MSSAPPAWATVEERLARVDAAAASLRATFGEPAQVAVVLGSGLGDVVQRVSEPKVAENAAVGLPRTGVGGHAGRVVVGRFGGRRVAVLAGRVHVYEGHELDTVVLAVRALARWGVKGLVLTSAVGGCDPALGPGSLLLVSDHINLSGFNPLRGPNLDALGPRFPDVTHLYSPRLRALAQSVSTERLPEGIYAAMPGPSYETPAEIRMLRTLGANVVGMSLVHEAIAAGHAGMEILAISVVSNPAAGLGAAELTHTEVTEASRQAAGKLGALLGRIVERW
jgi:purine-nucleoside phosphorylase